MKILIFGHRGMLGSELMMRLQANHEVAGQDIPEIDITSYDACRQAILSIKPDLAVNAAAFTDVDACETRREECFAVNALGVGHLALICRDMGIKLVHFSTDYVFNGRRKTPYAEEDFCDPLNVYGLSKLEGEKRLQEAGCDHLLIRTAWLYGKNGKNFVRAILARAETDPVLDVVDDQMGCPTYSADLSDAARFLIEGGHSGIYHVTNSGQCTWYEFACRILKSSGILDVEVRPTTSDKLARPACRSPYSVLNCEKYFRDTGHAMRHWTEALNDYLSVICKEVDLKS